jgi:hypothetical protein
MPFSEVAGEASRHLEPQRTGVAAGPSDESLLLRIDSSLGAVSHIDLREDVADVSDD